MSSGTVWDLPPGVPVPGHDPVSGKLDEPPRGGFDFGVFADLALHIGGLTKQVQRQADEWDRRARDIPADYQVADVGAFPASGTLALDLGSPDQGTFWNVRRIVVGGSDITTTPAGVGWVFIQGSAPNQNGANPSIAQVADVTSGTLPQRAFYGVHEMAVTAGEHLWVIIVAGTAGTQYVASAKLEVYDLAARRRFGA